MHRRIIQLDFKPVPEDEYINSSAILDSEEWFLDQIADSVSDHNCRTDDINWFVGWLESFAPIAFDAENSTITFSSAWVHAYFAKRHQNFLKTFEDLSYYASFDDFVHSMGLGGEIFCLQDAYDDRYGFYIYSNPDSEQLMTFDAFLRHNVFCERAYYIGGIVDYHF